MNCKHYKSFIQLLYIIYTVNREGVVMLLSKLPCYPYIKEYIMLPFLHDYRLMLIFPYFYQISENFSRFPTHRIRLTNVLGTRQGVAH